MCSGEPHPATLLLARVACARNGTSGAPSGMFGRRDTGTLGHCCLCRRVGVELGGCLGCRFTFPTSCTASSKSGSYLPRSSSKAPSVPSYGVWSSSRRRTGISPSSSTRWVNRPRRRWPELSGSPGACRGRMPRRRRRADDAHLGLRGSELPRQARPGCRRCHPGTGSGWHLATAGSFRGPRRVDHGPPAQ